MTFTLYGYEENPRSRIVCITAAAAGISLDIEKVSPRDCIGLEAYIEKFPRSGGKIPALECQNVHLTEVIAITWYIASIANAPELIGNGKHEQAAEILSWCSWANQELQPTLWKWLLPLIPGWTNPPMYDHESVKIGKFKCLQMLDQLENYLPQSRFLVGNDLTLADIFVHAFLTRGFEWVLDAGWRDDHPRIWAYYTHKQSLKCFKDHMENFKPIAKETPNVDPYKCSHG